MLWQCQIPGGIAGRLTPPYTGRRTGDGGTGKIPKWRANQGHRSGEGLFSLVKIEWIERDGRISIVVVGVKARSNF